MRTIAQTQLEPSCRIFWQFFQCRHGLLLTCYYLFSKQTLPPVKTLLDAPAPPPCTNAAPTNSFFPQNSSSCGVLSLSGGLYLLWIIEKSIWNIESWPLVFLTVNLHMHQRKCPNLFFSEIIFVDAIGYLTLRWENVPNGFGLSGLGAEMWAFEVYSYIQYL